jgi:methenyltetrahydromethanopterin cyclohydrolase
MTENRRASVNRGAAPLVRRLIDEAAALRLRVERVAAGYTLIDAGIACPGGIEAGLRVAEICLGGLGRVTLQCGGTLARWPWTICVSAADPVLACLGSQYAGWQLTAGQGADSYMALGSGPARALAAVEPLFHELGYHDAAPETVLVLEVDKPPPTELIDKVVRACAVAPHLLSVVLTPTKSLAGTAQIVARSLEVALHKAHEIGFPLDRIVDGMGAAPLPPPAPDFLTAMGRTNDAIIYGGDVQLFVRGSDDDAKDLAERLPSRASRDHGRPFAEIFGAAKGDFYAIDRLLFSPARVLVTAVDSGQSFRAGEVNAGLIDRSFGGGP